MGIDQPRPYLVRGTEPCDRRGVYLIGEGGCRSMASVRLRRTRDAECDDPHVTRSSRLVLCPMVPRDRDDFMRTIDGEVVRWQGWTDSSVKAFKLTFARTVRWNVRTGCPRQLGVFDCLTDRVIGQYMLNPPVTDGPVRRYEIGWWLGPGGRGRGLGQESLRMALTYFHDHPGLETIEMGTSWNNERAIRQIEACGAMRVRTGLKTLPNGTEVEGVWFTHDG